MGMSAGSVEVHVGAETRDFDRGMGVVERRMKGLGGGFAGVTSAAKVMGLGLITAGGLAVKSAGNFEQSMNVFEAVSGATTKQMSAVSKAAVRLGADVKLPGTSARDAADAFVQLAKGGLNVKQSMGAARGVLLLSAAAQISNADAATITARALNAFGLAGNQATRVADMLAAASAASTAEIGDLAQGMQMASAVFKMGNQSIQSLTTGLALMANAGIAGSDAGTSLKTMMLSLQAPTDKAAGTLKKLGINVRDAGGHMLPMRDLVAQFTSKTEKLTDAQRDSALATIFGSDAIRAASVVLGGGVKSWDAMNGAVTKAGVAQALADAQTQGLNGKILALMNSVETAATTFGSMLLPQVTAVTDALAKGVGILTEHKTATSVAVTAVAAFVVVVGAVNVAMATAGAAMKVWAAATAVATAVQWAFNVAMTANPIGIVVVALAAFAAAVVIAYKRSETFRNIVDGAFSALKTAAAAVKGAVVAAVNAMGEAWRKWGDRIIQITKTVFTPVVGIVSGALQIVRGTITGVLALIHGDWGKAWGALKTVVSGVFTAITALLRGVAPVVAGLAFSVGKAIVQGVGDGIQSMVGWLVDKAKSVAMAPINAMKGVLGIKSPSTVAADQVGKPLAAGIGAGFAAEISRVATAIGRSASAVTKAMVAEAKSLQGELDRIQARRETEDRATAVRQAQEAVTAALKEGKGVAEARRTLDRALEDQEIATNQKRLGRLNSHVESMLQAIEDKKARFQAAWNRLASAAITAFDRTYSGMQTAAERELALIERTEAEKARVKELSAAQAQLAAATTDEERLAATERVEQAELAIRVARLRDQNVAQRAALDEMLANKKTAFETALEHLRRNLEKEGATQQEAHARIMALYRAFGVDYQGAGANLGQSFVNGIRAKIPAAQAAARELAAAGAIGVGAGVGGAVTTAAPTAGMTISSGGSTPIPPDNAFSSGAPSAGSNAQGNAYTRMAEGAVVKGGRGGVRALIGEKSWDEAVVPLRQGMRSQLFGRGGGGGNTTIINLPNYLGSERDVAKKILSELGRLSLGGGALFSRTAGVTI